MVILHFFEKSKILLSYLNFLRKNYEIADHHFVIWDAKSEYFYFNEEELHGFNVNYISRISLIDAFRAARLCEEYDIIVFHSLFFPVNLMLSFTIKRAHLYKTVWTIWGGDLANYVGNIDFKRKMWAVLRNRVISRIGYVVTTNVEYNLLTKTFNIRPTRIDASYPYLAEQSSIPNQGQLDDKQINILLGNYATRQNRHIETLYLLSKFKDHDIKIYIPLSYGDQNYARDVKFIAKNIFEEKAIPLTEFMDRKEYGKLLSRIKIGIFNSSQQMAMGTIYSLLLSETKIFTDPSGSIGEILLNERGLKIHTIDEIRNLSFDDFVNIHPEEVMENRNKAMSFLSNENIKKQWSDVFNIRSG